MRLVAVARFALVAQQPPPVVAVVVRLVEQLAEQLGVALVVPPAEQLVALQPAELLELPAVELPPHLQECLDRRFLEIGLFQPPQVHSPPGECSEGRLSSLQGCSAVLLRCFSERRWLAELEILE